MHGGVPLEYMYTDPAGRAHPAGPRPAALSMGLYPPLQQHHPQQHPLVGQMAYYYPMMGQVPQQPLPPHMAQQGPAPGYHAAPAGSPHHHGGGSPPHQFFPAP